MSWINLACTRREKEGWVPNSNMRMTDQVVIAVNILEFIPSRSFPIHRYAWHLTFNLLAPEFGI